MPYLGKYVRMDLLQMKSQEEYWTHCKLMWAEKGIDIRLWERCYVTLANQEISMRHETALTES